MTHYFINGKGYVLVNLSQETCHKEEHEFLREIGGCYVYWIHQEPFSVP